MGATILSQTEQAALCFIAQERAVLVTRVPEKNERGDFGEIVPGIRVYRSLDRQGLVIITEEEPDEDGFEWTPMIEITDAGRALVETLNKRP